MVDVRQSIASARFVAWTQGALESMTPEQRDAADKRAAAELAARRAARRRTLRWKLKRLWWWLEARLDG